LRATVRRPRETGDTVLWTLPGDVPSAGEGPHCDRELIQVAGHWTLQAL
jgi:hypothetical protein